MLELWAGHPRVYPLPGVAWLLLPALWGARLQASQLPPVPRIGKVAAVEDGPFLRPTARTPPSRRTTKDEAGKDLSPWRHHFFLLFPFILGKFFYLLVCLFFFAQWGLAL